MVIESGLYLKLVIGSILFCYITAFYVTKNKFDNYRDLSAIAGVLGIIFPISIVYIAILSLIAANKNKNHAKL
ncbi:hypothetical protein KO525_09640 [Psychrosphaera sp. B3R10]|uniref:hypothetical protein n=1 Tax=Psychrosphaera sp. B3R10 TaxID=2841569 RepID=UPI001C087A24|nr:hypothetical protein [Psychrosphaera sp. B3R10]MBU2989639.1 hypothetical protein [Psychrosphaera sp. B3R10]